MSITDNQNEKDKGQGKQGMHQGQVARNQQGHGQNEVKGQKGQAQQDPYIGQAPQGTYQGQQNPGEQEPQKQGQQEQQKQGQPKQDPQGQGKQGQQGSMNAHRDTENEDKSDQ